MTAIPIKLTALEARLALYRLKLKTLEYGLSSTPCDGPVIVGEMPGKNTSPACPVFPYPHSSAGGRLMKMSGLDAATYLSSFHRVNLFTEFRRWSRGDATRRALELFDYFRGRPMVLLGARVAEAFGVVDGWFVWRGMSAATPLVAVPHPSGLNRAYNDEHNQHVTGVTLRDALVRWQRPQFMVAGDRTCPACGKRVDAHPRFRPELSVPLHVDCYDAVYLAWPRYWS